MKPEIKDKWLEALRSGKYEQGTGVLEDDGKFCCLGVLSALAVNEGVLDRKYDGEHDTVTFGDNEDDTHLPPAVAEWAGIRYYDKYISDEDGSEHWVMRGRDENIINDLMLKNDNGMPFVKIANQIEKEL